MAHLTDLRNRFTQAKTAVRGLLADPNDTTQAFRLLSAFSQGTPSRLRARFLRSGRAATLLDQRPCLRDRLNDRESLAALPEGSLGRAYLRFMDRAGITPDGLVEASETEGRHGGDDEVDNYIAERLRDTHDIWHVVTGYRDDLLGEAALLAFTLAQTGGAGIAVLVAVAFSQANDPDARRLIIDGFLRGFRSAWLPAVAWEDLLGEDLETIRNDLRVGPPPTYEPFFATELPEGGLLAH